MTFPKPGPRPRNKYGAKRVTMPTGQSFPSRFEFRVYSMYQLRQMAGEISELERYDTVFLTDAKISYKPDGRYFDLKLKQKRWIEAKGVETERWRIIKKLWAYYGPGPLEVWKAKGGGIALDEVIMGVRA